MSIELRVKYLPLKEIFPTEGNPRTHSPKQINLLAKCIKASGVIGPLVVDEDRALMAGNARLAAAKQLGLETVPTICVTHLSEPEKRAFIMSDNRIAELADWDQDKLRTELEFLSNLEIDFDIELTGFGVTDIDLILEYDTVPSSDDEIILPRRPSESISRKGDIWQLKLHRVATGDSRNSEIIDQLMDGKLASMVLSDPPYNLKIGGVVSGLGKIKHPEFPMASGELSSVEFTEFLTEFLQQASHVSVDGAFQYIYMDFRHMGELLSAGTAVYKQPLVNLCVWTKTNAGMGSLYRNQHEFVFIFKKGTAPHPNNVELGKNGRYRTNVWKYAGANSFGADRDEALAMHPTVKTVQMLADAILDVTRLKEIIFDGFLGSGSTLIAAERTGRICYGVELDPGYVDVTVRRWESISGERATLAGTDMNIDQVAIERGISQEVVA